MSTPNLAIAHIQASQDQKEVTANAAFDALDLAMTASLAVDCSTGGTIPVSAADLRRHVRLPSSRSQSLSFFSTSAVRANARAAPPSGSTCWSAAMPFRNRCWTRPQTALVIGTLFLTGCAGVGSDAPPGACPPAVDYSRAEQAQAAEEVAALPEGAAITGWLADYAVLREQVRACQ